MRVGSERWSGSLGEPATGASRWTIVRAAMGLREQRRVQPVRAQRRELLGAIKAGQLVMTVSSDGRLVFHSGIEEEAGSVGDRRKLQPVRSVPTAGASNRRTAGAVRKSPSLGADGNGHQRAVRGEVEEPFAVAPPHRPLAATGRDARLLSCRRERIDIDLELARLLGDVGPQPPGGKKRIIPISEDACR